MYRTAGCPSEVIRTKTKLDETRSSQIKAKKCQRYLAAVERGDLDLTDMLGQALHPNLLWMPQHGTTNSGTKTAPLFTVSRCGSVESQRLASIREPHSSSANCQPADATRSTPSAALG